MPGQWIQCDISGNEEMRYITSNNVIVEICLYYPDQFLSFYFIPLHKVIIEEESDKSISILKNTFANII